MVCNTIQHAVIPKKRHLKRIIVVKIIESVYVWLISITNDENHTFMVGKIVYFIGQKLESDIKLRIGCTVIIFLFQ